MAVPTDVAGLVAWYDFSDVSTLFQDAAQTTPITDDGQIILGVAGKGSTPSLSVGANGPTYKTAIQNGLSIARFDGVDDELTGSDVTDQPFSCFVLAKAITLVTSKNFVSLAGGASLGVNAGGTNRMTCFLGSSLNSSTDSTTTAFFDRLYVINGISSALYQDGGSPGVTGAAGLNNPSTFRIGNHSGNFINADYGEVVLYNSMLALSDLNLIGRYLASKWNLSWTDIPRLLRIGPDRRAGN